MFLTKLTSVFIGTCLSIRAIFNRAKGRSITPPKCHKIKLICEMYCYLYYQIIVNCIVKCIVVNCIVKYFVVKCINKILENKYKLSTLTKVSELRTLPQTHWFSVIFNHNFIKLGLTDEGIFFPACVIRLRSPPARRVIKLLCGFV